MFYIFQEKFKDKHAQDKKHRKVRDPCHYTDECRGTADSIHSVPKEISIIFYNRSNYDYHFIIKVLAEELEGKLTCLGENTDKYITFTVQIEIKVITIDKKGKNHKN